jgi:hypothetical protein
VLTEHGIQHPSGGGEEFIIFYFPRIPLTVGDFENRAQEIRQRLIGAKDTEIVLICISPLL